MRILASLLFLSALFLSGCESVSENMRERFNPVPPKVQQFDGDLRTVFTAAQLAFKRLDFVLTDSSGAPTRLEASSRIITSESLGDSRQLVVTLRLHEVGEGKTEVEALVSLQVENPSLGGVSSQNKREHGFYENYFATLQQVLQDRTGEKR